MGARATAPWWWVALALGCGDGAAAQVAVAPCAWGACAHDGPRCVLTGLADARWLREDFDDRPQSGCAIIPPALAQPFATGHYVAGPAPVGEVRCEGLQRGSATLRLRARARMLTTDPYLDGSCDCGLDWNVVLRVDLDGQATQTVAGVGPGEGNDPSCRQGPNLDEGLTVTVGDDGRLHAVITLDRCDRPYASSCIFLRGTGVEVTQ